jgi:hypothetical protein
MLRRILSFSAVVLLATSGGAAAHTWGDEGFMMPPQGLILDGGDAEAAGAEEGSCLDPSLAAATGDPAPAAEPSLIGSVSARAAAAGTDVQSTPPPRPMAFEYSDGYRTRLKIHRYASFATIPLFVAQYAVGQKLYDGNGSDGTRSLHGGLAATTAVLFGVNTVTGVWNLREGRKDPNHRTKRMVHGILMLVADAGFVATGLMTPESEGGEFEFEGGGTSRSTHRTVALTSMGIATVGYLIMLFGQ